MNIPGVELLQTIKSAKSSQPNVDTGRALGVLSNVLITVEVYSRLCLISERSKFLPAASAFG